MQDLPQQALRLRRGRGYSVNVPLRQGIGDAAYAKIFKPIMDKVPHAAPHLTYQQGIKHL